MAVWTQRRHQADVREAITHMVHESVHVGITIECPPDEVVAYVTDPRNLPEWAAGLARSNVTDVDGRWTVDAPFGRSTIEFEPANDLGVVDHVVTLPDGSAVHNPMRVVRNGDGCDVIFSVRRQSGMSSADFESDIAAVRADLETLRTILEP